MADVNITVDGKKITQPSGTLLIEACKGAGIEIPSFCYYPGLSLQGACRMCLVEIAKMPKLQTACTTFISEGMVVTTQSEKVKQARKAMLEFVLQNHPLDCPVCDAGGQCELQDATLSYGPGESKLIDPKNHKDEQQWSPVVYFDRPRCIMCYRCVRICSEGMDVWALGIANRNSSQLIVPNKGDYLECEECGMCIDICPVGALTSGPYRYKTRPWEMKHVATICTHCGDGCTTTLGRAPQRDWHGDRPRLKQGQERHQWRFPGHQGALCVRFHRPAETAQATANPQEWSAPSCFMGGRSVDRRWTLPRSSGDFRRQLNRSDWFDAHDQRRELLATESCTDRSSHQQHRSSSNSRFPNSLSRTGGQTKHHGQHERCFQRSRHPAHRRRSHISTSAIGVADPEQCAPTPRPAVSDQCTFDQVDATSNPIRTG